MGQTVRFSPGPDNQKAPGQRRLELPAPPCLLCELMRIFASFSLLLFFSTMAMSQTTNTFLLWSDAAPGALGKSPNDVPTLTYYPARNPSGAAMVICPGGGYGGLAAHEGE